MMITRKEFGEEDEGKLFSSLLAEGQTISCWPMTLEVRPLNSQEVNKVINYD